MRPTHGQDGMGMEKKIHTKKAYLEDRPFLFISYQTLTSARLTLKVEEEYGVETTTRR